KLSLPLLTRVAAIVGARGKDDEIARVLTRVVDGKFAPGAGAALLSGLGQGMRGGKVSLSAWLAKPPTGAEALARGPRGPVTKAAARLADDAAAAGERVAAAGLLALGPFDIAGPALTTALAPTAPGDVQLAAVRALAAHTDTKVAEQLLKNWRGYGPAMRTAVL